MAARLLDLPTTAPVARRLRAALAAVADLQRCVPMAGSVVTA